MVKMSFTDNQVAFDYALYMIAASYLDKAVCKSKLNECRMFLQYNEQKLERQYSMEDICIKFMNGIVSVLPKELFAECVDVHLGRKLYNYRFITEICFVSELYTISFYGIYKGKKTKIRYKLIENNAGRRGTYDICYV